MQFSLGKKAELLGIIEKVIQSLLITILKFNHYHLVITVFCKYISYVYSYIKCIFIICIYISYKHEAIF